MLSLDEARRVIAESLHLLPAERVRLAEAHGRFLRAPAFAMHDLPAFDRSAFDGYALAAQAEPAVLRLAFEVAAGGVPERALATGECARIFTGAPLPQGADAVAMQEVCDVRDVGVSVPAIAAGEGVRRRGEDAREGSVLVPSGVWLGAVELSLLAQMGHTEPVVAPRPRVFHVRTGEEIVSPNVEPGPGQIRDSNSTLIAALVAEAGGLLAGSAASADDLADLVGACGAAEECEVLLISGGASVGDYDFGKAALAELGFSVRFAGINLRPGKPLIFATRGRQAAFVIPGNPLSHLVCWHAVMRSAMDVLIAGVTALDLTELRLEGEDLRGNPRETWWPARVRIADGVASVVPLKWRSSGDMTGMVGVDALVRVRAGMEGVKAGSLVEALLLGRSGGGRGVSR